MHAPVLPPLATVDAARLAAIEEQLDPHAAGIGAAYLVLVVAGLLVGAVLARRWRQRPPDWAGLTSRLLWRPWTGTDVLLFAAVLGGLYLLLALLQSPVRSLLDRLPLREESSLIVLQSLTFHWAGLALAAALLARRRVPWASAFGLDAAGAGPAALRGVLALLAAIPLIVFYTFLYQGLLRLAGYETGLQEVAFTFAEEPLPAMRVYFVFLSVALAPLFEEMLFRGILLPVLARRFGVGVAVILVSALFAVIHLHVPSVVPLFVLSTALCLTYILTGSLLAPVVMHALFNGMTVLLLMGLGS